MEFERLENNLIDVCLENQAKIGYTREKMRLYYPLSSLNHILQTTLDSQEMEKELLARAKESRLGELAVTRSGERFCFLIPEEGCEYVHFLGKEQSFIIKLVESVQKHGVTIMDIKELFLAENDKIVFEKMESEEFDYLLFFAEGKPDHYYYCFKEEGCHMTYHRFTKEDYEDLFL